MNIVTPYARIILPETLNDSLRRIEYAARISHRSEDDMNENTTNRFIQAVVVNRGDWSVTEHVSASVEFLVDRGITHELVRHRLFSFTQESTRFVNYTKKMPPSFVNPFSVLGKDSISGTSLNWIALIEHSEMCYKDLLSKGCAPQIARSVFPN